MRVCLLIVLFVIFIKSLSLLMLEFNLKPNRPMIEKSYSGLKQRYSLCLLRQYAMRKIWLLVK